MKLNPFIRYGATHLYFLNKNYDSISYDCRLFYVEEGNGTIIINETKYSVEPKTVIYLPPKSVYNFNLVKSSVKILVINFDLVSDFDYITNPFQIEKLSTFNDNKLNRYDISKEFQSPIVKIIPTINNKITAIIDNFNQKDEYFKDVCSAELKLVLLKIIKLQNDTVESSLIKSVITIIKKEYQNPNLSNEEISSRFNYHPYHLNKIFKQKTGTSLHKYLLNYRLEVAKYYLTTTDYSITKISELVGFFNYSYFIKLIRETFNLSPLKYRKLNSNI